MTRPQSNEPTASKDETERTPTVEHTPRTHSIIVVGASSGGVEALSTLVAGLPANLPAAVFIVLHVPSEIPSHLPEILGRVARLPTRHPHDREPIALGHIYVAPPDYHLVLAHGCMRLVRSPRENRHRPAIDPLFRSAALTYGSEVVGVVLSGALDDGTAGLYTVKERGGVAVVQDPTEALVSGMPLSALEYVAVDYTLSVREMPALLTRLARTAADPTVVPRASPQLAYEAGVAALETDRMHSNPPFGTLVPLSCPECNGPIWEYRDGGLLRFRCQIGHSFSIEAMAAAQSESLDQALWSAYKTLRGSSELSARLAVDARGRGHEQLARRFETRHREHTRHAETILRVLSEGYQGNGKVAEAPDTDDAPAEHHESGEQAPTG